MHRLVGVMNVALTIAATAGSSAANTQARGAYLRKLSHIVVIYEENHSFDNLYGLWGDVDGVETADFSHTLQVNQDGSLFACLEQVDVNLTAPSPLARVCTDSTSARTFESHFPNSPWLIDPLIPPTATTCPAEGDHPPNGVLKGSGLPGGCTRDLVHRYYQEIYQLNKGRQDRYVTGSDAAGLAMGIYHTPSRPIYIYLHGAAHPNYAIADAFFAGAFGGSFLNHQMLISATAPKWAGAVNDGSANDLHSVVDGKGMPNNYPLYVSPAGSAVKDLALTASCSPGPGRDPTPGGVTCGDYAVNTVQPTFQPFAPGTSAAKQLPPLENATIGDELISRGVDWAWYSGGWSNANGDVGAPGWSNGSAAPCSDENVLPDAVWPNCPDKLFQFHHQPFNYYAAFDPSTTRGKANRRGHLKDEVEFVQLASSSTEKCRFKPVSFIKPIGEENQHPGYASASLGDRHLVDLLKAIEASACASNTMVVVTYDEFGGQWDHVPPPGQGGIPGPHDAFGPGTRVPALILAPGLRGRFVVDHAEHDTTSIIATIEHRFDLKPLGVRDAQVRDLASVFVASPADSSIHGRRRAVPKITAWRGTTRVEYTRKSPRKRGLKGNVSLHTG